MKLTSLAVENLYGSLKFDINFNERLNLLVGINGSGKTSALNVIDWLLAPNFGKIALTPFDCIRLALQKEGQEVKIEARETKSDEEDLFRRIIISVEAGERKLEPIDIKISGDHIERSFDEDYSLRLKPEKNEEETVSFLKGLRKPTAVSLERTITAEVEENIYYEGSKASARPGKKKITPLEHIQDIFTQKYATYRQKARLNDSELKSKIFLTALHSPGTKGIERPEVQLAPESVEVLEEKVTRYLSASIKSEDVEKQVKMFFSYFKNLKEEIERNSPGSDDFASLVQSQFERVDQLARAFNEFENKNATAFKEIDTYLKSVNKFLKDSGKFVFADDSRGQLVFDGIGSIDKSRTERPIRMLSSGETQILILFALIAFEAPENSVFIVDEPELSLHPKWQMDFMDSFLDLCPAGSQILIATHSPEIVAGKKDSCIVL
ncbi:AAA family ATPase [Leisingera sp. ANG-S5]|uniref:AAA family ATPase n=1 Tax=Leisingera sp. ANG-S5 TaxID=1577901 RepID=UPI00058083B4|nr:AAA family ATPase [Leisingera sp. ANG-S5]KIC29723.1 hypothetical protein RA25_19785 [Leisingera sp. ANG-S5]